MLGIAKLKNSAPKKCCNLQRNQLSTVQKTFIVWSPNADITHSRIKLLTLRSLPSFIFRIPICHVKSLLRISNLNALIKLFIKMGCKRPLEHTEHNLPTYKECNLSTHCKQIILYQLIQNSKNHTCWHPYLGQKR